MNVNMNINPEMLADHFVLFVLLGLVEKDNDGFLLNKSEAWKELIDLIEKRSIKVKLLQRFFKIKSIRRQKFKKLQKIMYGQNQGRLTLSIINDKNIKVAESIDNRNDIDDAILETLKLTIPKTSQFTDKNLKELMKKVKDNLNKKNRRTL